MGQRDLAPIWQVASRNSIRFGLMAAFVASLAVLATAGRDATALAEQPLNKMVPIQGRYVRSGKVASATLDISVIAVGRIAVSGVALWGTNRPVGPNIGELEFQTVVEKGRAVYQEKTDNGLYRLTLRFLPEGLTAVEQGSCPDCGLNVYFSGTYRRTSLRPATGKP